MNISSIRIKICWHISMIGLMGILLSCGSSPIEDENHEQDVEQPDLKDMVGNVEEWTADWYAADYYIYSPRNNPKGPDNGIARVLKGGSWRHQKSHHVLSANRNYQIPDYGSNFVGFRCAWSKSMIGQCLLDTKR